MLNNLIDQISFHVLTIFLGFLDNFSTAPLKAALILKVIKVLSMNDPHNLNKKTTDFKPSNINLLCRFSCRVWTSLH